MIHKRNKFYVRTFSRHFLDILENKLPIEWDPEKRKESFPSIICEHAYGVQCNSVLMMAHLIILYHLKGGPRWHSGYGAVLQIGRSLVRSQLVLLEFFINIILPIALWPWGQLSL